MVYRQMGIQLPRNSNHQLHWDGFREVPLEQIEKGDLIFFGQDPQRVCHVGLCLGGGEFIHASVNENKPYLRISHLNDPAWNGSGSLKYRFARRLKSR
ncbi:MAG: Nlp/P60 [Chlamydiales bacterium]|jgi:cell wall-associated NlpC family hydrolase|nr:Nlp/P60 [Chlamydiales bacterium]